MDSTGGVLLLDGGPQDGAMVLEGWAPAADDLDVVDRQRITWTREGERRSARCGRARATTAKTWTVAFDGRYRRR